MNKKVLFQQKLQLWAFPVLQVAAFNLFFLGIQSNYWFILFIPISAFFLNFSLHITYHHTVHFPIKSKWLNFSWGILKSILMGLPFHYYEMSHWNHHKHNNNLNDFTSTWREKGGRIIPKNVFIYAFFWPFSSSISLIEQIKTGKREGYCTSHRLMGMYIELFTNSLFFIFLGSYSWIALIGYFSMIYIGWALIAIHNFGQHLPQQYNAPKANSFPNACYNWLFVNNGLHEEHHEEPSKSYWELTSQPKTELSNISKPHIIEAFFHSNNQH